MIHQTKLITKEQKYQWKKKEKKQIIPTIKLIMVNMWNNSPNNSLLRCSNTRKRIVLVRSLNNFATISENGKIKDGRAIIVYLTVNLAT
jgi:hypothetical protein